VREGEGGYSSDKPLADHPAQANLPYPGAVAVLLQCRSFRWWQEMGLSKRGVRLLWLVLLVSLVSQNLRAEIVRELYSAQVPVADQSSSVLTRASGTALSEVLVKVSGSTEVLANPVIVDALGSARSHVQQYAYARNDGQLSVRIEFAGEWVTALVIEAGVPLWTANRPAVLVWLVVDDGSGRRMLSPDSDPELVRQLRDAFARRGVPLQLPLFDLADTAALPPAQAWSLDTQALAAASGRYNLTAVLSGRLAHLSTGAIAGDWVFFYGDERMARAVTAADEQAFLRDGAALVAEDMAARFAVTASADGAAGLAMQVSGVSSYADYAAIVNWLESLELIERANVEWVRGDSLQLRLLAQADAAQLAGTIELNKRLQPVPAGPAEAPGPQLNYQWQN
jgi:hypothetical protein